MTAEEEQVPLPGAPGADSSGQVNVGEPSLRSPWLSPPESCRRVWCAVSILGYGFDDLPAAVHGVADDREADAASVFGEACLRRTER